MSDVTIYYNPRCSTCRKTLKILEDRGVEPTVVRYLDQPPDETTLRQVIDRLGVEPIDLIRTKEPLYKELGLDEIKDDRSALIRAMVEHPILIQRPIVVTDIEACVARPPENVLEIL